MYPSGLRDVLDHNTMIYCCLSIVDLASLAVQWHIVHRTTILIGAMHTSDFLVGPCKVSDSATWRSDISMNVILFWELQYK